MVIPRSESRKPFQPRWAWSVAFLLGIICTGSWVIMSSASQLGIAPFIVHFSGVTWLFSCFFAVVTAPLFLRAFRSDASTPRRFKDAGLVALAALLLPPVLHLISTFAVGALR